MWQRQYLQYLHERWQHTEHGVVTSVSELAELLPKCPWFFFDEIAQTIADNS